jgi:hypothetical protein
MVWYVVDRGLSDNNLGWGYKIEVDNNLYCNKAEYHIIGINELPKQERLEKLNAVRLLHSYVIMRDLKIQILLNECE